MKMLSFLLLACTASALLNGAPSLSDSEKHFYPLQDPLKLSFQKALQNVPELQILYHEDFLDAPDHDILDLALIQALANSKSGLTYSELKEKFKLSVSSPDLENLFLSVYSTLFNEEELREACALVQDESYIKLRKKLSLAHYICFMEAEKILENLVSISDSEKAEITKLSFVQANHDNFEELIKNSSLPVILDVYTDWCGPCKHLALVMKELYHEYGDVYQFAKLDAEKEKKLAKSLKITSYPTIIFFKDGKEVGRQKGFKDKEGLLNQMNKYFQK